MATLGLTALKTVLNFRDDGLNSQNAQSAPHEPHTAVTSPPRISSDDYAPCMVPLGAVNAACLQG